MIQSHITIHIAASRYNTNDTKLKLATIINFAISETRTRIAAHARVRKKRLQSDHEHVERIRSLASV